MWSTKEILFTTIVFSVILPPGLCNPQGPVVNPKIVTQSSSLGDCQACKLFVESFKKGLKRTARGKYEGGDAAWEEEVIRKSYKRSELRLIDIQEGLCKEVKEKHSVQCHHMAERAEEFIDQWWARDPSRSIDMYSYICIDKLKVCCPVHHYGKDCTPCPGDHENLCSGNGNCRGDGTRKGNGTCLCNSGYEGVNCEKCMAGYYLSYKNEKNMLCSMCHKSCMGGCRGGSQKDCAACKPGFKFDSDAGCLDVNECLNQNICKEDEYCLNSIGSYVCMKCDVSCSSCHGDGPDMCKICAEGFAKDGEFCTSVVSADLEKLTTTRYMMYVGMIISIGIVLPASPGWASVVSAALLSYLLIAEFYCMINGHQGLFNLKQFDLMQLMRI